MPERRDSGGKVNELSCNLLQKQGILIIVFYLMKVHIKFARPGMQTYITCSYQYILRNDLIESVWKRKLDHFSPYLFIFNNFKKSKSKQKIKIKGPLGELICVIS